MGYLVKLRWTDDDREGSQIAEVEAVISLCQLVGTTCPTTAEVSVSCSIFGPRQLETLIRSNLPWFGSTTSKSPLNVRIW